MQQDIRAIPQSLVSMQETFTKKTRTYINKGELSHNEIKMHTVEVDISAIPNFLVYIFSRKLDYSAGYSNVDLLIKHQTIVLFVQRQNHN